MFSDGTFGDGTFLEWDIKRAGPFVCAPYVCVWGACTVVCRGVCMCVGCTYVQYCTYVCVGVYRVCKYVCGGEWVCVEVGRYVSRCVSGCMYVCQCINIDTRGRKETGSAKGKQ
jgi:hypothetical protein